MRTITVTIAVVISILIVPMPSIADISEFMRDVNENAPEEVKKLIKIRNRMVDRISWTTESIEVAGLEVEAGELEEAIGRFQELRDEAQKKIVDQKAAAKKLVDAAGGENKLAGDDKALYDKTKADIAQVEGILRKINARLQEREDELTDFRARINKWKDAQPHDGKSKDDDKWYDWFRSDTKEFYIHLRYLIKEYLDPKLSDADLERLKTVPLDELRMNAKGEFGSRKGSEAFTDPKGIRIITKRLYDDYEDSGISEADRELAKKMLVTGLRLAVIGKSYSVSDDTFATDARARANAIESQVYGKQRVSVKDLADMYDLLIETAEKSSQ